MEIVLVVIVVVAGALLLRGLRGPLPRRERRRWWRESA